jgi:hypothetical protein
MGFFDSLFGGGTDSKTTETGSGWGNVFASLVPALVSGGSKLLEGDLAREDKQEDREFELQQAKEKTLLELKLAEIKARYGSGGGGGGASRALTDAQRLSAVAGQGDAQQKAIESLIAGLQGSYNLAGRR